MRRVMLLVSWATLLSACAASNDATDQPTKLDGAVDAMVDAKDGAVDEGLSTDGDPETAPTPEGAVYAHTYTDLYRLDTTTLVLTKVGPFVRESGEAFAPPAGIQDIAIDKNGVMYGVAQEITPAPPHGQLYRIDYKLPKPKCTPIKTNLNVYANGLTFVPAGMLDPTKEVLVASGASWWRIDVGPTDTSATATVIGGLPSPWVAVGGDSVGIIGDAVYTTAVSGTGTDSHLLTFDPKTGTVKDLGATGVHAFWGLGYWGGELFGFVNDGAMWRIDRKTAKATKVPLTIDGLGWYGAAVTTSAPIVIK